MTGGMTRPISVGIIGLGRSGWDIHAAGVARLDAYEIVATADPVPERRAEAIERYGCTAYGTPEELVADPSVDVVVVATPSHTHLPLTVSALEAGKHVVVEKPMAQSTAEVDAMVDAASSAGRVVTCFHNRRFDPSFLTVRDILASGRLGELISIRRTLHRFVRRADWQTLRELGGGELSNTASHLLDQVLLLLDGEPTDLFADLRRTVSAGDAEDHVKLCFKTTTGPVADIECSTAVAIPQPEWAITGTTGSLTVSDDHLTVRWFDPSGLPEPTPDAGAAAGRRYGSDERIEWFEESVDIDPPSGERTLRFYEALADTLLHGAELVVSPQSVRRRIALLEHARQRAHRP
ncbi:gfo/Idh/MocA family oxidoreductase [Actinobacteria bacterium YIM 96077]|uniref:Gfo/Idh/MocA family oxidoreductase n=1 Tax=Phytoactinopolyspora halophila TaxID=1981511 RepID=A0A329R154_9ACTN|nr:Gfo/Idh/MocA family oxidoreductase [Phytoactinopolyspora halophila]AYY11641.1 gfo/Idh/MocA family oxidoreductase [Actinobacteria bacterium YIM 96077]RAW17926.1 hypothetical protein DPM12_03510 [Phytoactinopolyspora halophila]